VSVERAVVLISHGSVERLDELPAFLATIRRGHAAPPELVAEVTRRYEAIGGRSPLNDINRRVAKKLEAKLGVAVRGCNRLAAPHPREALRELADAKRIAVVPLAQHSAEIYGDAVREAAREVESKAEMACAANWGATPALIRAYAKRVADVLDALPKGARTTVVMSAHSLPVAAVRAGDPYEDEVRGSAAAVERELASTGRDVHAVVAFQSQGMSSGPGGRPVEWLGPDLRGALDTAKSRGDTHVVVAPIGFLCDHVEILFDVDIEAREWAKERGLVLSRTASLNDSDDFIEVLAEVARPLLEGA
jgi:protoporphyrin/coproporphyrin ferrochelatase